MKNTIFASAALLAAPAIVNAAGQATVVNSCSYPVTMQNTPSSGGGYSEIDQTLQPGGSYSQQYTQLSNGNGWSLKLSQSSSMSNILQYEYTFHDDGIIWFDLSEVNGNPWDGNWEITATGACTPRQAAYRYATDDAYGMQSCPDSSSVTVTLCSGDSGSGSSGGSGASSSPSAVTTSAASTWTSAASSPSSTYSAFGPPAEKNVADPNDLSGQTTARRLGNGGTTVTNFQTQYVTYYVTASPVAEQKRHAHHLRA